MIIYNIFILQYILKERDVSGEESLKESEDRDSPTEDVEVDAPPRKVAEIDRDVIENNVNDEMKDNKLASS